MLKRARQCVDRIGMHATSWRNRWRPMDASLGSSRAMPATRPRGAEAAGAPRAAGGPRPDDMERAAPSIRTPFAARVQLALKAGGAAAVVGYCLTAGPQTFARNGYIVILLLIGETLAAAFPITVNRPPAGRDRARGATDHTGIRAS